jgi:hypothetical protein
METDQFSEALYSTRTAKMIGNVQMVIIMQTGSYVGTFICDMIKYWIIGYVGKQMVR